MIPTTSEAYKLMHEGTLVLSDIESNGMRIDLNYCRKKKIEIAQTIKDLTERVMNDHNVLRWQKREGIKFKLGSPQQLASTLYNHMGLIPTKETATGQPSTDKEALADLNVAFIKDLLDIKKWEKVNNTYLENIIKETDENGILHPVFNLHIPVTYRSSSNSPNFQNMPVRDPVIAKAVRSAFIPRNGRHFTEFDYSSLEVGISVCYHKDPTMFRYCSDPASDMHRDIAFDCYLIDKDMITKPLRQSVKGGFVFSQFYGSYYKQCAELMWKDITISNYLLADGTPLMTHLKKKKLNTYTRFERHLKKLEDDLWNNRFPIYSQWKDENEELYHKQGYIITKTGFKLGGNMSRNDVNNYPIQGSAFHCLLWSLIEVHKWLKKNKMRTKIIGQIHDSIVMDIHKSELQEVLTMTRHISTTLLKKHWAWIITPLELDAEVSPLGMSWFDKKDYIIPALNL